MKDGGFQIFNLNNQFVVTVVVKLDNDGFRRIVNIPENSPSMLIKSAGNNETWNIDARQFDAMPPSRSFIGIDPDGLDVLKRDVQLTFERPEFVQPLNLKVQHVVDKCDGYHRALDCKAEIFEEAKNLMMYIDRMVQPPRF